MAKRRETVLQGPVSALLEQLNDGRWLYELQNQGGELPLAERGAGFAATGGVFCLLAGIALGSFALGGVGGVLVVGGVTVLARGRRSRFRGPEPQRLDLARELLQALQPDFSPERALTLTLRFGDWPEWGTRSQALGGLGPLRGPTQFKFSDTWLVLEGHLSDESALKLEVTTFGQRKYKANWKGTAIRDEVQDRIEVTLNPLKRKYPRLGSLKGALDTHALVRHTPIVKVSPTVQGAQVRVVAVTAERYGEKGRSRAYQHPGTLEAGWVVGLLGYLYSGLGACRTPPPVAAPEKETGKEHHGETERKRAAGSRGGSAGPTQRGKGRRRHR